MNTKGFSDDQKNALLDLLVLGMYQDRHLAAAEDERVRILADSFHFESDYARQQFIDAGFGRVNALQQSPESIRSAVFNYASRFSSESQRRQALDVLPELLSSDDRVTTEENTFLAMVKEALAL